MVERVVDRNEISLNGTRYPIKGRVSQSLISVLPSKVTIGEYSLSDEQLASTWIINDQRGGLGIEEMDESIHQDRFYWSTCDTRYKGHITLNPLATEATIADTTGSPATDPQITNPGFEDDEAAGVEPTGWTSFGSPPTYETSTTQKHSGAYSLKVITDGNGWKGGKQSLTWDAAYQGVAVTANVWIYQGAGNASHIRIYDGTDDTYSSDVVSTGSWVKRSVTHTMNGSAGELTIQIGSDETSTSYFDNVMIEMAITGTVKKFCTFNGVHYMAKGSYLQKRTTTSFATVSSGNTLGGIIKALVPTDDHLYIFCGDGAAGWAMDTDETLTQVPFYYDWGIWWDSKLMGVDSKGQCAIISSPDDPTAAGFDITNKGKLPLDDADINNLIVYRDADADPQIYAATKEGFWVHDYTNAKWVHSELTLPDHVRGGKGAVKWHDAAFISSGLHVDKYIAASTATILSMGLDEGDGLPPEFSGEINTFVKGHNSFAASIDSSLATGTNYSGIYTYNGKGWRCAWIAATAGDVMYAGDESTVSAYQFWFDHDNKVYSIPFHYGVQSPLKISSYAYATGGMHITPWFDGKWIGSKLALSLKMMCDNTLSETEKITAYYRIDHSTTTIPVSAWTGWTKLTSTTYADGVTADGEAEFEFGTSGVGIAFKSIQFAFHFERTNASPSTDKLKTPDLQYVKFKYLKQLDKKWGWNVVVDLTQDNYKGNSPSQLKAALETMATPGTLKEFTYRDDTGGNQTFYCTLAEARGMEQTGEDWSGFFQLKLVAP